MRGPQEQNPLPEDLREGRERALDGGGAEAQPAGHRLGRARPRRQRLLRPPAGADAAPRPPGGAGDALRAAYCASPVCVPSRLALLTGRYAHQVGAWDNDAVLDSSLPTWGHYLGGAGYETVLCGRTHFNGSDRRHGFERRTWTTCRSGTARRRGRLTATPGGAARGARGVHGRLGGRARSAPAPARHLRRRRAPRRRCASCRSARRPREAPLAALLRDDPPALPPGGARGRCSQRYDPAQVELPPTWDEGPQRSTR